jgi:membrane protein DedA with SNARE-associated domain
MLAIISFAAGALLGLRFKVFVLVPATLAVLVAAACSLFLGYSIGAAVTAFVSATIACQIGYLIGNVLRSAIHSFRRERADHKKHKIDALLLCWQYLFQI